MGDCLIMSKKERQHKTILDQVLTGFMSRKDARKRLQIGSRQLKRIIVKYRTLGDAGLVHQSRGKPSGRAYPPVKKARALSLYKEKYLDFGPTFAAEKLHEEDKLDVHPETLRLWLKAAGLWQPHRKRKLLAVVDELSARFGREKIRWASEGIQQEWAMRQSHLSKKFTSKWDDIPVVNCYRHI